jgi:hypothetical protein
MTEEAAGNGFLFQQGYAHLMCLSRLAGKENEMCPHLPTCVGRDVNGRRWRPSPALLRDADGRVGVLNQE